MKKIFVFLMLLATISTVKATDGDQMLGITAKQWARGGAIIAAPVDIPSMLYNPAALGDITGLNNLGFDLSLGVLNPPRKITNPMTGETESNSNAYLGMGNGFAAKLSEKIYLGVAAGGVSGMGVDFPSTTLPDNPGTPIAENASIVTKKGLLKIVPTIAFKLSEKFIIGVSLQIGQQSLALKTPAFIMPQTEKWGFGGAIGMIYHITQKLQAGLSYTSKMNISEYEFNGVSPMGGGEGIYKMEMNSPQNFAFGLALKPMPKLTVEADVKWYNFSDVMGKEKLNAPNGTVIPLNFGWDDQIVYALGISFHMQPTACLQFGYNYGATPIGKDDVDSNLGSIAVVEHHLSIGVSKKWNDSCGSTLSYTYGMGNEVVSSVTGNKIEAQQNIFMLQFSYRL
jgi:long-chain fatty acid transport protein